MRFGSREQSVSCHACPSRAIAYRVFCYIQFNPLAFWSFEDCWTYLRKHNVPYHPLHDVGFSSLGDMQSTRKVCPTLRAWEDRSLRWCSTA